MCVVCKCSQLGLREGQCQTTTQAAFWAPPDRNNSHWNHLLLPSFHISTDSQKYLRHFLYHSNFADIDFDIIYSSVLFGTHSNLNLKTFYTLIFLPSQLLSGSSNISFPQAPNLSIFLPLIWSINQNRQNLLSTTQIYSP